MPKKDGKRESEELQKKDNEAMQDQEFKDTADDILSGQVKKFAAESGATVGGDWNENISNIPEIRGWSHNLTFSSVDYNTLSWTSGSLDLPTGTSYSINSGDTGDISSRTFIYFDKSTSETDLQTTTTPSNAVGANKIMIAVAQDTSSGKDVEYQVFGGEGGFNKLFTANSIAADTITANEITSNTITASEIDTGTITTSEVSFTVVDSDNVVGTINASTEGIDINGDTISLNGDTVVDGTFTVTASDNISDVTSGADVTGNNTAKDIVNLPDTESGSGLYANGTYLGFYDGSDWTAYIDNTGDFYFEGDGDNYLTWDGSQLKVVGDVRTSDTSTRLELDNDDNAFKTFEAGLKRFEISGYELKTWNSGGDFAGALRPYGANKIALTAGTNTSGDTIRTILTQSAFKPYSVEIDLGESGAAEWKNIYASGTLYLGGDVDKGGTSNFDIKHPLKDDEDERLRYTCMEGPEVALFYRGTAETKDGEFFIKFPDHYAYMVTQDRSVNLTPHSNTNVWVDEITKEGVKVKSEDDTEFSYMVMGKRRDYEDYKVEYNINSNN